MFLQIFTSTSYKAYTYIYLLISLALYLNCHFSFLQSSKTSDSVSNKHRDAATSCQKHKVLKKLKFCTRFISLQPQLRAYTQTDILIFLNWNFDLFLKYLQLVTVTQTIQKLQTWGHSKWRLNMNNSRRSCCLSLTLWCTNRYVCLLAPSEASCSFHHQTVSTHTAVKTQRALALTPLPWTINVAPKPQRRKNTKLCLTLKTELQLKLK